MYSALLCKITCFSIKPIRLFAPCNLWFLWNSPYLYKIIIKVRIYEFWYFWFYCLVKHVWCFIRVNYTEAPLFVYILHSLEKIVNPLYLCTFKWTIRTVTGIANPHQAWPTVGFGFVPKVTCLALSMCFCFHKYTPLACRINI